MASGVTLSFAVSKPCDFGPHSLWPSSAFRKINLSGLERDGWHRFFAYTRYRYTTKVASVDFFTVSSSHYTIYDFERLFIGANYPSPNGFPAVYFGISRGVADQSSLPDFSQVPYEEIAGIEALGSYSFFECGVVLPSDFLRTHCLSLCSRKRTFAGAAEGVHALRDLMGGLATTVVHAYWSAYEGDGSQPGDYTLVPDEDAPDNIATKYLPSSLPAGFDPDQIVSFGIAYELSRPPIPVGGMYTYEGYYFKRYQSTDDGGDFKIYGRLPDLRMSFYCVPPPPPANPRFLFRNSFGVFETFHCWGECSVVPEYKREFQYVNGEYTQVSGGETRTVKCDSGYLPFDEAELALDFLRSPEIYTYYNSYDSQVFLLGPRVVITDGKVDYAPHSTQLQSVTFTVRSVDKLQPCYAPGDTYSDLMSVFHLPLSKQPSEEG